VSACSSFAGLFPNRDGGVQGRSLERALQLTLRSLELGGNAIDIFENENAVEHVLDHWITMGDQDPMPDCSRTWHWRQLKLHYYFLLCRCAAMVSPTGDSSASKSVM
jgi:hypothetical protein